MNFSDQIKTALESKEESLREHLIRYGSVASRAVAAFERIANDDLAELIERLKDTDNIGALPSDEVIKSGSFKVAFDRSWQDHESARKWAAEILNGRKTFAADGSQVYSSEETSIPVAMIRIGWFENPHNASKDFDKGRSVQILTPEDLFSHDDEKMNPDIRVEQHRYLGEVAAVSRFIKENKGWQERGERMPLAFFDDPLLVPFSQKGLQKSLLDATVELVALSAENRVPLIGYVDRSFSRDIVTMLSVLDPSFANVEPALYDGWLLRASSDGRKPLLDKWGERTCFFHSKRRGLGVFSGEGSGITNVGFSYLQTTRDAAPARVDVPAWCYESGLLDEIIDVVRAECVVGLGYPYPLEAADQTAFITGYERDVFFSSLQKFAESEKLDFSVSRKNSSKARRR